MKAIVFILSTSLCLVSCKIYSQCNDEFAFKVGRTVDNSSPKLVNFDTTSIWLYSSFIDTLLLGNDTIVIDTLLPELYLIKYNVEGDYITHCRISGSSNLSHGGLAINSVNEVYLCGSFRDTLFIDSMVLISSGEEDFFVLKVDSNGNPLWAKRYGSLYADYCNSISVWNDTVLLFGGAYLDSTVTDSFVLYRDGDSDLDAFFVKSDTSGNVIFAKSLGGIYADVTYSLTTDSNSVYVAGTFNDIIKVDQSYGYGYGNNDVFVSSYNINTGELSWIKTAGGKFRDVFAGIATDTTGNIYVSGSFVGTSVLFDSTTLSNGSYDVFQIVFNNSGSLLWSRELGFTNSEIATAIAVSDNNRLYTAFSFNRYTEIETSVSNQKITSKGEDDIVIVKSNNEQNIWVKSAGSSGKDYASNIKWIKSNHLMITGIFNGNIEFIESEEIVSQKNNNVFIWKSCD